MTTITLETIEVQTTNSNLERGKSYFYSGQVSDFRITNNRFVQAKVNSVKNYRVFIEFQDDRYNAFCNCPYDSRGYCKHTVAVKFALMEAPDTADCIEIPQWQELVLKYSNRLHNLFYQIKYKLF